MLGLSASQLPKRGVTVTNGRPRLRKLGTGHEQPGDASFMPVAGDARKGSCHVVA